MFVSRLATPLFALLLMACLTDGGPVAGIDATGEVRGTLFTDIDADGTVSAPDQPVQGAQIALVVPGTEVPVATATTDAQGSFALGAVAVGRYELMVPASVLGDSLVVATARVNGGGVDPDQLVFTLGAEDSVQVAVALAFPQVAIEDLEAMPLRAPVRVDGIALTATGAFGGRSLHVLDATGALRVLDVTGATVIPGDSVRVLGRTDLDRGQTVLSDGRAFVLAAGPPPPATLLTTDQVPTAAGGAVDAALVEVVVATIEDSEVIAGDLHLTVNDGSGSATVVLYRGGGFNFAGYPVGMVMDATGVLVPADDASEWVLMPRHAGDIRIR